MTTARPSCLPQPVPVSMPVTGCSMPLPSSVCSPFPPTTALTFPSAGWDLAGGYPCGDTQPCLTTPTAPSPLRRLLIPDHCCKHPNSHGIFPFHYQTPPRGRCILSPRGERGVPVLCSQMGALIPAFLMSASCSVPPPHILGVSPLLTLGIPWQCLDRVAQPWWAARGHCCQTPGTASPCPRIPAQDTGTSIPRLQLIQAAALCSPFKRVLAGH